MLFRMGVNVGDVMFKEGDIFGDGVNVAAGSRDWSGVARSAFRGACTITCVIAAWPSMIWANN